MKHLTQQIPIQFLFLPMIMKTGRYLTGLIFTTISYQLTGTVKGNIAITIDTTGYVSNSVFKGNFQKEEINKINYYLSVIYGLKPYTDNGMKYNKDINLKVYSNVDSSRIDDTTQRSHIYTL